MELNGKCIKILETYSKVSQRTGEMFVKNSFVLEVPNNQYTPRKVAITVMGADKWAQMKIEVGKTYNVSFDIESHEWQGKWYTECKAWKVAEIAYNNGDATQQAPKVAQPQPAVQAQPYVPSAPTSDANYANDMPF